MFPDGLKQKNAAQVAAANKKNVNFFLGVAERYRLGSERHIHGIEPARVAEKARCDLGKGENTVVDGQLLLDEEDELTASAVKVTAIGVVEQQSGVLAIGVASQ